MHWFVLLRKPKNALVKQYKKLFDMDHVDLEIQPDAIEAIAEKALERKTGARGLRGIMEKNHDQYHVRSTIQRRCEKVYHYQGNRGSGTGSRAGIKLNPKLANAKGQTAEYGGK